MPSLSCRKFARLTSEQADRELSAQECDFLEQHRQECSECSQEERSQNLALNMLRAAAIDEPEVDDFRFDERVIRRARVQQVRESLGYWMPAAMGALAACVAVFATLHLIARPTNLKNAEIPAGQAHRIRSGTPYLGLPRVNALDQ